ncbi:hypothetical protein [Massilia sp. PWRC2]|uniref:hypothetical protein n=1 Tax=Massilia sp. PWRC2 TaxID=2804626 RepID=UPI003CE6E442
MTQPAPPPSNVLPASASASASGSASAATAAALPFRASTEQACAWLAAQTGDQWDLARLLAHLTPYVWLDYDASLAELFGEANGGYAAPIFYQDDIARLVAGSDDVLITRTKDVYKIVAVLPPGGLRRPLAALLFQQRDIERLPAALARAAVPVPVAAPPAAKESQAGIGRHDVLAAFAPLVKIDLDKAMSEALGVFGDDGARVKGSARKSPKLALWNPVTLALGLNDLYRVPLPRLSAAFRSHACLDDWRARWELTLELLR